MKNPYSRRARSTFRPALEALEDRLAPAVLVNNTLTYQDVDGDNVTVQVSKGTLAQNDFTFNSPFANTGPQQLQLLNLTSPQFQGANLSVTAVRSAVHGGDGFVNIGEIQAIEVDLGAVTVQGDLGKILAGDGNTKTPGLSSLTVQSLGRFGTTTGAPDLASSIQGSLGTLTVKSDIDQALFEVAGGADGTIGQVVVGGSLLGGSAGIQAGSVLAGGIIATTGNISSVLIKGNVVGSDLFGSGAVQSFGNIGSLTVGGSVFGGSGNFSGELFSGGSLGPVTISGSLVGGSGVASGRIEGGTSVTRVTLGGSVVGGPGLNSAQIVSDGNLGPVSITGSLTGGDGFESGSILAGGLLAGVTIGGSVIGGSGNNSGTIVSQTSGPGTNGPILIKGSLIGGAGQSSGTINVQANLASVTVGRSVIGGDGDNSGSITSAANLGPVHVTGDLRGGNGQNTGQVHASNALASITIGRSVIGGAGFGSGLILGGKIGPGLIRGDILGGGGFDSGDIDGSIALASLTVGGSVQGGTGPNSATIAAVIVGPVKIAGDLRGGSAGGSGEVLAESSLASLTIGGSLIGGTQIHSGTVLADTLGPLWIGHDMVGGTATGSDNVADAGTVLAGRIASVYLGGSLIAGTNLTSGIFQSNGAIQANHDIGAITIRGSLIGNATNAVIISAVGQKVVPAGSTRDVAIASLTVGGRVEFANIFAGYDTDLNPVNANAQIGAVKVGGDWIASNLVAGVAAGTDRQFGTADDVLITDPSANPKILASIASVTIGGQAQGLPGDTNGHFGIVAQHIGALSVAGTKLTFHAGVKAISLGATGDFTAREVG
jgi:hypothetical protein